MLERAQARVLPVINRGADIAPVAPACCNVCRTCVTTNLAGLVLGACGALILAVRRLVARATT